MSDSRLNISRVVKNETLAAIDKTDFLGLSNESCERIELFLFAMAMGAGVKWDPERIPSIALIRVVSVKPDWQNLMYATYIASLGDIDGEVKLIGDDSNVTLYCSKCADAGFQRISEMMKGDQDVILEEMTADLVERYKDIAAKYPELGLGVID